MQVDIKGPAQCLGHSKSLINVYLYCYYYSFHRYLMITNCVLGTLVYTPHTWEQKLNTRQKQRYIEIGAPRKGNKTP